MLFNNPMVLMEDKCDFIKIFNNTQFNIYGLSTEFKRNVMQLPNQA